MQKKYLEIKDYLMERIRSGEYKPEQATPAEGQRHLPRHSQEFQTRPAAGSRGQRCQDRQLQALLRGQLWLQDAES